MVGARSELGILVVWCLPIMYYEYDLAINEMADYNTFLSILYKLLPEIWTLSLVNKLINNTRNFELQRKNRQILVWRAVMLSALAECLRSVEWGSDAPVVMMLGLSHVMFSKAIHSIHINNWLLEFSTTAFTNDSQDHYNTGTNPGQSTKRFSIAAIGLSILSLLMEYRNHALAQNLMAGAWLFMFISWLITISCEKISYLNSEPTTEQIRVREVQSFIVFWGSLWKMLYIASILLENHEDIAWDPLYATYLRLGSLYISDYVLLIGLST